MSETSRLVATCRPLHERIAELEKWQFLSEDRDQQIEILDKRIAELEAEKAELKEQVQRFRDAIKKSTVMNY